jgi:acyl phosphate:glycerol-3-phosphate acyltransferase
MKYTGRKIYHILGGMGLLSLYFVFNRSTTFVVYGVLIVVVLMFEIVRIRRPVWNNYIYTHLGGVIRANEEQKMTGTVPYILGVGLSLYAYSTPIATAAVCFLAFGDVAATTIGERYGKTKIGGKSLEGTAAFIVASLLVGFLLPVVGLKLASWVIVLGALAAASIELLPISLNDNLIIPIMSGAVMALASMWAN